MGMRRSFHVNTWFLGMLAACGVDHSNTRQNLQQVELESVEADKEEIEFYAASQIAQRPAPVFLVRGTVNRFKGGDVKLAFAVKGKTAAECESRYNDEFQKLRMPYQKMCENALQAPISKSIIRSSPRVMLSVGETYPADPEKAPVCIYAVNIACMAYPYNQGFSRVVGSGDIVVQGYATDTQRYWRDRRKICV